MNKQSLNSLHWVTFTLRDWKRKKKKPGCFKRLEKIKEKCEELLNAFSASNRVSKTPRNKVDNQNKENKNFIFNSQHSFVKFKGID